MKIESPSLGDDGMVFDFGTIKATLGVLDHTVINDIPPFNEVPPTAENLARWACEIISRSITRFLSGVTVAVTVEETPGSSVTYRQ